MYSQELCNVYADAHGLLVCLYRMQEPRTGHRCAQRVAASGDRARSCTTREQHNIPHAVSSWWPCTRLLRRNTPDHTMRHHNGCWTFPSNACTVGGCAPEECTPLHPSEHTSTGATSVEKWVEWCEELLLRGATCCWVHTSGVTGEGGQTC